MDEQVCNYVDIQDSRYCNYIVYSLKECDSRLVRLVDAYKEHGHKKANLDPLLQEPSSNLPEFILNPQRFGLSEDKDEKFVVDSILPGYSRGRASLSEVLDYLEAMYCGTLTIQTAHIGVRAWKLLKHCDNITHTV